MTSAPPPIEPCPDENHLAELAGAAPVDPAMADHLVRCAACRDVLALADIDGLSHAAGEALHPEAQGRYTALSLIGVGGQAIVWRVFDIQLKREVALKELRPQSTNAHERFVREARVMAMLSHPAILPVFDVGIRANGQPYYTMPVVEGQSLRQRFKGERPAAWPALLPHVVAASEAIAYAHAKGVVHRDVTPANVLTGQFGATYVIDWGLSRHLMNASDEGRAEPITLTETAEGSSPTSGDNAATITGSILGTPGYMSPEQRSGEAATLGTDVWGLGALLFEILWQHPPGYDLGNFHFLHPDVPKPLLAVVRKALAPEASDRYGTAGAFADDLRRFLGSQRVLPHRYSTWERFRLWARRNIVLFRATLITTASVLAALGLIGLSVVKERSAHRASMMFAAKATTLEEQTRLQLASSHIEKARDLIDTKHYLEARLFASAAIPLLLGHPDESVKALPMAKLRGIDALTRHQPVAKVVARRDVDTSTNPLPRVDIAWDPTGQRVAILDVGGAAIYDANGAPAYHVDAPYVATSVAWGERTDILVLTHAGGLTRYERGHETQTLVLPVSTAGVIRTSALTPSLRGISATSNGQISFIDDGLARATPGPNSTLTGPIALAVIGGRYAVLGGLLGDVEVWDLDAKKLRYKARAADARLAVALLSPMHLAIGGQDLQFLHLSGARPTLVTSRALPSYQLLAGPRLLAAGNPNTLVELTSSGEVGFRAPDGELLARTKLLIPPGDQLGIAARGDGRVALYSGGSLAIFDLQPTPQRLIYLSERDAHPARAPQGFWACRAGTVAIASAADVAWTRPGVQGAADRTSVPGANIAQMTISPDGTSLTILSDAALTRLTRPRADAAPTKRVERMIAAFSDGTNDAMVAVDPSDLRVIWLFDSKRGTRSRVRVDTATPPSWVAISDDAHALLTLEETTITSWEIQATGELRRAAQAPTATAWTGGIYWEGNWVLVGKRGVQRFDARTLEPTPPLSLPLGSLNSFQRQGDELFLETMGDSWLVDLRRNTPIAAARLEPDKINTCQLDADGGFLSIDTRGRYLMGRVVRSLYQLAMTPILSQAGIDESFTPTLR